MKWKQADLRNLHVQPAWTGAVCHGGRLPAASLTFHGERQRFPSLSAVQDHDHETFLFFSRTFKYNWHKKKHLRDLTWITWIKYEKRPGEGYFSRQWLSVCCFLFCSSLAFSLLLQRRHCFRLQLHIFLAEVSVSSPWKPNVPRNLFCVKMNAKKSVK